MRKFDKLIEAMDRKMDRREFIKKVGKGATATGLTPGGAVGKVLGNITGIASGNVNKFLPDNVVMSLFNLGKYDIRGISKSALIQQITNDKNNLESLNNFLQKNPGSVGEIYNIEPLIGLINIAINSFTGKWSQNDKELAAHWGFELERLTPSHLIDLIDQNLEDGMTIQDVLKTLFEKNAISPEAQSKLEYFYDIYKCDFVQDPVSKARKNKRDAEYKKHLEKQAKEWENKQYAQNIDYSRMDKAGGSEDIGYAQTYESFFYENYADGKKPGRKGLAKRSGVNCKQSVSKLRKIAKNSSGERQRMAHWCANMKSGKKK